MNNVTKVRLAWKYRGPLWKYRGLVRRRKDIAIGLLGGAALGGVIGAALSGREREHHQ